MKAPISKKVNKIIKEGKGHELLKAIMLGNHTLKNEFDIIFDEKIIHVKKLGI